LRTYLKIIEICLTVILLVGRETLFPFAREILKLRTKEMIKGKEGQKEERKKEKARKERMRRR
jgi:hypothetical protein